MGWRWERKSLLLNEEPDQEEVCKIRMGPGRIERGWEAQVQHLQNTYIVVHTLWQPRKQPLPCSPRVSNNLCQARVGRLISSVATKERRWSRTAWVKRWPWESLALLTVVLQPRSAFQNSTLRRKEIKSFLQGKDLTLLNNNLLNNSLSLRQP